MSKKRFNPVLFCQSTNVCILKRLKYDVPKEKEKPTVLRIALAYIFSNGNNSYIFSDV